MEIARAGGGWIWHYDLATINRGEQIEPRFGCRQPELLGLDRVEADCSHPGFHADPKRWVCPIAEYEPDGGQIRRRIRLEETELLELRDGGHGKAPDRITFLLRTKEDGRSPTHTRLSEGQ